jgi:hypothetical protein
VKSSCIFAVQDGSESQAYIWLESSGPKKFRAVAYSIYTKQIWCP